MHCLQCSPPACRPPANNRHHFLTIAVSHSPPGPGRPASSGGVAAPQATAFGPFASTRKTADSSHERCVAALLHGRLHQRARRRRCRLGVAHSPPAAPGPPQRRACRSGTEQRGKRGGDATVQPLAARIKLPTDAPGLHTALPPPPRRPCTQAPTVPSRFPAADWRHKARPIPPGGNYPAKEHCSHCGLW